MNKVHNFWASLKWSERASDEPFWGAVYQDFFGKLLVNHMPAFGDYDSQRMGVDRLIYLSNNRIVRIDEKKRDKNYPDIALEIKHTKERDIRSEKVADGWVEKDLHIDYIAYAFMPSQTVYMLDWLMLQRAYRANKMEWWLKSERKYKGNPFFVAPARNKDYWTHSLCVPISELYRAMNASAIVRVNVAALKEQSA